MNATSHNPYTCPVCARVDARPARRWDRLVVVAAYLLTLGCCLLGIVRLAAGA